MVINNYTHRNVRNYLMDERYYTLYVYTHLFLYTHTHDRSFEHLMTIPRPTILLMDCR